MALGKQQFLQLVQHPIKFRLFLLANLPSAFFSGLRVQSISDTTAVVTVPYKWFSKNPFKSTYFACLAMAAELSTGLLVMMNTYKHSPAVSMLVTHLEAHYYKKATGIARFSCVEGAAIQAMVAQAIQTGEGCFKKIKSTGTNELGEPVADFFITWAFKVKTNSVKIIA